MAPNSNNNKEPISNDNLASSSNSNVIQNLKPTKPTKPRRPSFWRLMKNRRFSNNESAIVNTLSGTKRLLSVRVISRRAKINPTTFYRHHQNVHQIIPDLEHFLYQNYLKVVRGLLNRPDIDARTLYLQTLVFILQNRSWFQIIQAHDNGRLLEQMIYVLIPKISTIYNFPSNNPAISLIFAKEIATIVEIWVESGHKARETEVLADMLYLTKNIRTHLIGLIH